MFSETTEIISFLQNNCRREHLTLVSGVTYTYIHHTSWVLIQQSSGTWQTHTCETLVAVQLRIGVPDKYVYYVPFLSDNLLLTKRFTWSRKEIIWS